MRKDWGTGGGHCEPACMSSIASFITTLMHADAPLHWGAQQAHLWNPHARGWTACWTCCLSRLSCHTQQRDSCLTPHTDTLMRSLSAPVPTAAWLHAQGLYPSRSALRMCISCTQLLMHTQHVCVSTVDRPFHLTCPLQVHTQASKPDGHARRIQVPRASQAAY